MKKLSLATLLIVSLSSYSFAASLECKTTAGTPHKVEIHLDMENRSFDKVAVDKINYFAYSNLQVLPDSTVDVTVKSFIKDKNLKLSIAPNKSGTYKIGNGKKIAMTCKSKKQVAETASTID